MPGKRFGLVAARKAAGLSQERLAEQLNVERSTVQRWEAGQSTPQPWLRPMLAEALGLSHAKLAELLEDQSCSDDQSRATPDFLTAPRCCHTGGDQQAGGDDLPPFVSVGDITASRENLVGGLPAAPGDDGTTRRRKALTWGLAAAVIPDVLGMVLADAAPEAMEFTQHAGLSAVGQGTLEHLELVINDLNRGHPKDPPAEQFVVARAYRSRVDELIRGRHTLKELQELYVYAAWLSELLAWLANDLGNFRTAQAYALDSYTYADEVGHDELCGWAANAMATIVIHSDPDSAAKAAMRGVAKVSTSHPLAVNLRAQAARAYARLGQRESCESLFSEAQRLHERLPTRAPILFTLDTGVLASCAMTDYPASAYLWLEDFETARIYGEAALTVHESAPPSSKLPSREAVTRLILATTLVQLGTPDEAAALGSQALTSTRVVTSVVARARDLDRALVSRYPRLACAREFHEQQYRHVAQRSAAGAGGA